MLTVWDHMGVPVRMEKESLWGGDMSFSLGIFTTACTW